MTGKSSKKSVKFASNSKKINQSSLACKYIIARVQIFTYVQAPIQKSAVFPMKIYCTIWPLGNDSHFRVYNFNFWVIVDDVDLLTLIASNFKFFLWEPGTSPPANLLLAGLCCCSFFLPFCGWKCALKFRKRPDV